MTRDQIQALVDQGILPWSALYDETFNWDLDASLFADRLGVNWEDQAPFFPETQIVQDVFAPEIVQAPVLDEPGGGGYSLPYVFQAQPISVDVFAPDTIEPSAISSAAPITVDAGPEVIGVGAQEEKPMGALDDLFANSLMQSGGGSIWGGILSGTAGAVTQELAQYLKGTGNPPSITGSELMQGGRITVNAYACGRGKHVSKALKGPSAGKCVTNRRMNPLNPKALARSVRRLSGFQQFATKTEKAIQASFRKAGVHPARRISGGRCGTCRKTKCSCG